MVDYSQLAPVLIENLCVDPAAVATDEIPMWFGAAAPADLYYNGSLVASSSQPLALGKILQPLPQPIYPDVFSPTDTQSITLRLLYGNPTSCSEADFTQGVNVAFVGGLGRWECIYFRDVTINGDGTVMLSHLLRAQRGSWYVGFLHAAGDGIVFGTDGLVRFDRPLTDLGLPQAVHVVPRGLSPAVATGLDATFLPFAGSIRPWAPVNPKAVASGSDLVISWTRVDRDTAVTLHDGDGTTPLTDAPEAYTLSIYKSPKGKNDTPLRTVNVSAATYTYLAADRATDGTTTDEYLVLIITQNAASGLIGYPFIGNVYVS